MVSDGNNNVNIFNKKRGGSSCESTQSPIGLDYSGIKYYNPEGSFNNRAMTPEVLNAITDSSITGSSVQSMAKTVNYGNFTNTGVTTPFSYGAFGTVYGGKGKKTTKKPKKTKTSKTSKTSKTTKK